MTYTVQELALQYAEALVEYHQAEQANTEAKPELSWGAYRNLVDCQEALNVACKRQAEMGYA